MIVIAGRVKIKPEVREDAIKVAVTMANASQAEAGCIAYRFYADLEAPNTFFIFEHWESEAALKAHFETPHMAEFRNHLPRLLAEDINIQRYDVSSVGNA